MQLTAQQLDDFTKQAQELGLRLEIGIGERIWADMMYALNHRPEQHRNPNKPPYFIHNGARIEPAYGVREFRYRY